MRTQVSKSFEIKHKKYFEMSEEIDKFDYFRYHNARKKTDDYLKSFDRNYHLDQFLCTIIF